MGVSRHLWRRIDLAPLVGADLRVMERDARKMRGDGPFLFAQVTGEQGTTEITERIVTAWQQAIRK